MRVRAREHFPHQRCNQSSSVHKSTCASTSTLLSPLPLRRSKHTSNATFPCGRCCKRAWCLCVRFGETFTKVKRNMIIFFFRCVLFCSGKKTLVGGLVSAKVDGVCRVRGAALLHASSSSCCATALASTESPPWCVLCVGATFVNFRCVVCVWRYE